MDNVINIKYLEVTEENRVLIIKEDKFDKYDYLAAATCGAVGAIIDIFFVGSPTDSKLMKWTNAQTNNVVKRFAEFSGRDPKRVKVIM